MARFPQKEAEIAALAERLSRGLLDNNPIYPQPPVHPMLDWKQPADGGKPSAYKVQRHHSGAEAVGNRWEDVATAILSEIILVEQPERTELEYRVIAINKSGEGSPSNTVMVVL
jgi:hypothetical protein